MFFSKFLLPTLAVFGMAASVLASPVAQPIVGELTKRGDGGDVYNACKDLHDQCVPLYNQLTPGLSVAQISVTVNALAALYADAKVNLLGLVGVDVTADVSAIVAINVDLIVGLIAALSTCGLTDLTIFAQIDAFVSAYLTALASIKASLVLSIGAGINIFVFLKLTLTVTVLGLLSILGL